MVEVLDIGDRVETGKYRLHTRFRGALAFIHRRSKSLVSVVDEGKCAGPVNIVVRGLDFARAEALEVAEGSVRLDGAPVTIGRRSDSRLRTMAFDAARVDNNLTTLREALATRGRPFSLPGVLFTGQAEGPTLHLAFARRFRDGVERLVGGDLEGASAIRGLGFGLTPSGDDFLAGFLLGLYAMEAAGAGDFAARRAAIAERAKSDNPFSAAMLKYAREGRCIEPARSLIHALFEASEGKVAGHAERLAAVGASSGADLATGLYFALSSRGATA